MEKKYYTNERSQQIVIALLKAHGIRKVVASPGTTNLTLVASMQQDPYFEMYSSVDERSAAYMACGLAAELGEPVVLSCTGATASRNYMPGLTEAYYRKLPVLAITATQGDHKIGHHFAQVIDRRSIPNDIARISANVPVSKDAESEWNCNVLVNKALLELKRHGGGPVHINLATTYSRDFSVKELPATRVIDRVTMQEKFPAFPKTDKVAIFVGSHKTWTKEEELALTAFCAAHNAVAFCDHTSGYKGKYRVLFALVAGQKQYHSPLCDVDLLIHIGEVSGDYYSLGIKAKQTWRVSEDGEIRDTFHTLRYVFEMPEKDFFLYYAQNGGYNGEYLQYCQKEYDSMLQQIPELPFGNIWMARQLAPALPEKSVLHLGILNTLRSWNFFEIPASVLSYCNVGGFGIDGDMSTLIGASLAHPDKLYFGILGDLAFFYDMNVLGNHHVGHNVRIMLINNGRGTEFRNYDHPGSAFGEDADKYIAAAGHYGNKSPLLIKHYAEDLGFEYLMASDKEEFLSASRRFVISEMSDKPMLFEVFTDSADESRAIEMMHHVVIDTQSVLENKIKARVKNVLGESGVQKIKKILGK